MENCLELDDAGVSAISKIETLTSLGILRCPEVLTTGFDHIATMKNLRELKIVEALACASFSDQNLQNICSNLTRLLRLEISWSSISNEVMQYLGLQ